MASRWSHDERRGSDHVCLSFQTGKHIWLSEHDFGSLKIQRSQRSSARWTLCLYVRWNMCLCLCSSGVVVRKDCFYHYQHLSYRVTPGSLISKLRPSLCVTACVCVCVRELFVLIRIKGLFQWEEALTLLNPCCLNPAANDLCLFLRSLYFLSHTPHNSPPRRYDNVPKKKKHVTMSYKEKIGWNWSPNGEHIEYYMNVETQQSSI